MRTVLSLSLALCVVPSLAAAEGLPAWLVQPGEELRLLAGAGGDAAPTGDLKHLSLSLSMGLRPDMAQLGASISQDGSVDTADSTMANAVYATPKLIMSDRDSLAIWHNSRKSNEDAGFDLAGEPTMGGSLLGLELGLDARYELDELIGLPLYAKVGFLYTTRISGGEQSRTLGNAAAEIDDLAFLLSATGNDPADYVGGTMTTTWDASWLEVPISLGFKVQVGQYSMLYARFGVSIFNGGFSVRMNVDENYANVLATHIDLSTPTPTVTNYSPGAVDERVTFQSTAVGINYGLGAQTDLGGDFVWFLELNGSGAAKTVFSSDLSPEAQQLLTATSSASLAEDDPQWFRRLAFPVVTAGATVRTGLRYYLF